MMTIEEVLKSDFVYLLLPDYEYAIPALINCAVSYMDFVGFTFFNSDKQTYERMSYGKEWLCFTGKLTKEQCKAVKWE